MNDTAVHWVEEVLPEAPVRHWVCTFPWGVRAVLGYDRELCREATTAFAKELSRSLKHRAKKLFGLQSVSDAHTGLIVTTHRLDGALRLNLHLHVLGLDGVYVRSKVGELVFHALPTPTSAQVEDIARRTAKRLHRAFQAQGRSSPWDEEESIGLEDAHPLQVEQPGLFACYEAAARGIAISGERAGQTVLRLFAGDGSDEEASNKPVADQPVGEALGVNIYARQVVDGRDRRQLERVARYVLRPPLAQERLSLRSDGRLELTLKNAWKDGTRAVLLEPQDLLVRLCASVPPPWQNQIKYYGVFASNSKHRHEVCPERTTLPGRFAAPPAAGDQLTFDELFDDAVRRATSRSPSRSSPEPSRRRSRWSWLLRRVFQAELDTCPRCGGAMRWLEVATNPTAIARLLAAHGLGAQPPPERRAHVVPLGQLALPFEP